jgi:hypothetical protein
MVVKLHDGPVVIGTAGEVVDALRMSAYDPSSRWGYKLAVRRRASIYHGKRVRVVINKDFLRDLDRLGEIKIIKEG